MGFPKSVEDQALAACARRCCICQKFCGKKMELHHIKQRAYDGEDSFENCIPLSFGMFRICLTHICVTVKAKRNTILKAVLPIVGTLLDMMQFHFPATELLTYTAPSGTCSKSLIFNVFGEAHAYHLQYLILFELIISLYCFNAVSLSV